MWAFKRTPCMLMLLFYSFFFASSSGRTAIPPLHLITSRESCLSNIDCPVDRYCKPSGSQFDDDVYFDNVNFPSTCLPRFSTGPLCFPSFPIGTGECEEGTFCGFLNRTGAPTCVKQIPEGGDCSQAMGGRPCKGGLECVDGRTCGISTTGFEGDSCQIGEGRSCQVLKGFYCRNYVGRCTARKTTGQKCGMEADNFECEGFCADRDPDTPGICQPSQKAGQLCDDDQQCAIVPWPLRNPRSVDALCNRPSGPIGVCVLEADLIKQLGAACNPTNDMCDARRGLSCADVDGENVCVQRATSPNSGQHFCTPDSPLSTCPPDIPGDPRECRRTLSRRTKQFVGTYGCRRRREVVPLGSICNGVEFAICEPGTVCSEVPGVQMEFSGIPPRGSPPLRTCTKVIPVGANCSNQFHFTCEEGTYCVDGVCRRVAAAPDVPITIASSFGNCTELACHPSLSCVPNEWNFASGKTCRLPIREAGLWQPCSTSAQFEFKCKKGLQCSRDYLGNGIRVCRPKRSVGGVCANDDSCLGDLKCGPSGGQGRQGKCYDPSLSLSIGDSCNPNPGEKDGRCVSIEIQSYPNGAPMNAIPLFCLPQNGSHTCQRVVGLFQKCLPRGNIACASRDLVCSDHNVCVPVSQI